MNLKRMIFAVAVALAVAVAALAQQQSEQPPAAPKLVIKSMTHDFGEVASGSPLSYSFVIKNEGKAELLIKSVTPG